MKKLKLFTIIVALLLGTNTTWAANIHECEDEEGNRTFQKYCPPGSTSHGAKDYSGSSGSSDTSVAMPKPVLYAVPNCDVCDQVREHMSVRNIPITEKNIKDNGLLQQELKSKTGGDLRVPVLLIGDKVLSGYDRTNLSSALKEAGYESEQSETE